MNTTVDAAAFLDILAVYLEAFAEHDPARRDELLARCFTADGEIWGPNRMFVGYAAISEKIAAFHVNWPDCRLVLASGIVTFDNVVRLGNALVGPDGAVRARGETIFALAPTGAFAESFPFGRRSYRAFRNRGLRILLCRSQAKGPMRLDLTSNRRPGTTWTSFLPLKTNDLQDEAMFRDKGHLTANRTRRFMPSILRALMGRAGFIQR